MALEDKSLSEDMDLDATLVEAIKTHRVEGKLPCARVFLIVESLNVTPEVVGQTADRLGVKLSRCQLGLFGYPGKQGWDTATINEHPVPEGLPLAIRTAVGASGNLACVRAWQLAEQFDIPRMLVGYVADGLGIHIASCQLGAF